MFFKIKKITAWPLIWIVIAVFVVKETAWMVLIPPLDAPDELGHYGYVESLYYERVLQDVGTARFSERVLAAQPITADSVDKTIYKPARELNWIAQHPPAYYMMLLPLYSILPHDNVLFSILVLRFVSILLGVVTIYYCFRTLQRLLPGKDFLSAAIVSAIAFLPTFSFMNAVMNNDNLVMALASVLFYLLSVPPKGENTAASGRGSGQNTKPGGSGSRRRSIKIGLILAGLALTKVSALPIFITVLIIQAVYYFQAKDANAKRSQLINIAIIFGLPLALASWWYVRNFFIYHTFFPELKDAVALNPQLLTTNPEIAVSFPEAGPHTDMKLGYFDFLFGGGFLVEYFKNIWMTSYRLLPRLADWQFAAISGFTLLGFGGWLAAAFKKHRKKELTFRKIMFSDEMISLVIVLIYLGAISWKVYGVTLARGQFGAMHGRYFFPALPAFFYLLMKGWQNILPGKWENSAYLLFMVLFILNDAGTLYSIISGFYL